MRGSVTRSLGMCSADLHSQILSVLEESLATQTSASVRLCVQGYMHWVQRAHDLI